MSRIATRDESLPLSTLIVLTFALTLATFMQVLDTTIANVSIPSISGDLGVTPSQGTWIITSFAVSNAISMPLTGWLARRFGEVKLFVLSVFLFSMTSLMCGIASNFEMLIIGRILQGAVAAPMMPLSQSLLLSNYPTHKKGLALAFWSMTATIGPIVGPLLGGYITDNFSWSWIFFINIPIGVFSSIIVWAAIKHRETDKKKDPIDYVGLMLLVIGVGSLQILLDKGNDLDWFSSDIIVWLSIATGVGLLFLVVWELFDDHPVIDLSLFGNRNFAVGAIAITLGYTVFLGGGVVFPLWLQLDMGYTAYWAGYASAAVGIFAFLLSPVIGTQMHKMNLRLLVSVSFVLFAISYFMMSGFTTQVDLSHVAMPRLVMGIAMAMFFIPLTAIILSQVEQSRVASAMGLVNFIRVLGGSFGTSIGVSIWDRWSAVHHSDLASVVTPFSHTAMQYKEGLSQIISKPEAFIDFLVTKQALTMSNDDILYLSGIVFLAMIPILWLAKPPFITSKAKAPVLE